MRKRIILIILLVFLISLAGGLYYVSKTILPRIVKQQIITGLSGLTAGKVTVENIRFNLFRGIMISGLTLFEKDNPQQALCTVKESSATFLIFPFFKEKRIIVPSLKINAANLRLIRQKDNTSNISYLIDKFKQPGIGGKTPSLLVKSIKITNSSLLFTDDSFSTPLSTTLRIVDLLANISWNKATLETSCEILRGNEKTNIQVKGKYLFSHQLLNGDILVKNINLKAYDEYLKILPITLEKGQLSELKVDVSVDFKKMTYQGKLDLGNALLSIRKIFYAEGKIEKSSFDFDGDQKSLRLTINLNVSNTTAEKDNLKVSAAGAEANVLAKIPLVTNENLIPSYEGTVKIKSGEISGIPYVDKISDIAGNIKFKNLDVVTEGTSAKILDTFVKAKGDFKQNILNLDLAGDFDLKKLSSLLPKDIKLPAYEITGMTNLNTHMICDFSKGGLPLITGEAALKTVRLKLPENNLVFETDKGQIKFDTGQESLQWHFGSVKYLDESYSFDGSLKGFASPAVSAMVIGRDIKVQTELKKEDQILNISSLKGQFKNSQFNMKGQWDLKENMEASGTILLDFTDLASFLPQSKDMLEKMSLSGQCRIDGEFSGPLKDYRLWQVKAKGQSRTIKCYGFKFQNVELEYSQIKQQGFIDSFIFSAYNGKGAIKGRIDFPVTPSGTAQAFTYTLRSLLQDIDLNLLKLDTPLKDKTFFGTLSMNISLQGRGSDLNALQGQGALTIKNGNVWEFNPLKGLGDFLFIPRFTTIVFSNAQGDFFLRDGYIATDNLELLGPELGLLVEGKISFKGELDFLVNTQIPQLGLGGTKILGKVTETVSKAGSLTAIKITGTVKEPKYKLQPITENIMKKLSDIFSSITP